MDVDKYSPEQDFLHVRDFLARIYWAFGKSMNWDIARWNWARYHPTVFGPDAEADICMWEDAVGVWENDAVEIVGVVNIEAPRYGDACFQCHPGNVER